MKCLVWSEELKLEERDCEEPKIMSPTDVKVRIRQTGICGTDLALIKSKKDGKTGIIRGHEAVGTVVEIGKAVKNVTIGSRVLIDPNQYCGKCYHCRRGETHLCCGSSENGLDIAGLNIHGTFAEYFVCSENFLYNIPENMDWDTALMVEPLACVMHNLNEANPRPDDSVLVIGSGPMGLLSQIVAKKLCRLTAATEKNEYRYHFSKNIADYTFRPEELTLEKVMEINSNRKFDIVVDAVGNQLEAAEKFVARGGKILLLGLDPNYRFTFSPARYSGNAVKILGCGEYHLQFEAALSFASITSELKKMVTKKYALHDYKKAFNELLGYDPEAKKTFGDGSIKTALCP